MRNEIIDFHFSERAFCKRPDYQSDHLVEKTVTIEVDCHARTFLPDPYRMNCADRAFFRFAAIGSEGGKIMRADKMFGCRSQNLEIERARDVPCTTIFEWRQNRC